MRLAIPTAERVPVAVTFGGSMSQAVIDTLVHERDDIIAQVDAIVGSDEFDAGDSAYVALRDRAAYLQTKIDAMREWTASKAAVADLDRAARKAVEPNPLGDPQPASWGDAFVRSAEFTEYPGRGRSAFVRVSDRALPMKLAAIDGLAKPQILMADPPAPTDLLSALSTVPLSQNSIDVVTYKRASGAAAVVAEGAAKPAAEWSLEVTPIVLETVAVHTQMTRQLMEDAGALRALIDTDLRRLVTEKQDALAAAAIHNNADIPTVEAATLLAAIRMGRAAVRKARYTPTHMLIHPDDLAALEIASWSLSQPVNISAGLTVVEDPAATPGEVIVGDLRAAVQRYVRTGVNIYITDSHANTFVENVFTLLAEGREKTVVTRPAGLVKVSAAEAEAAAPAAP